MIFSHILVFLIGAFVGYIVTRAVDKALKDRQLNIIKDSWYGLLSAIESGKCIFVSRINNYAQFQIRGGIFSGYVITLDIVEAGVTVTKNNKIILTSEVIRSEFPNDSIIDDIIEMLNFIFGKKINDVVDVNGDLVDREYLKQTMKKSGLDPIADMALYDGQVPKEKVEDDPSVDDILDKILKDGIDSLTQREREILDERNKEN